MKLYKSHVTCLFSRNKSVIQLFPITIGSHVGYWYNLNNPTFETLTFLASSGSTGLAIHKRPFVGVSRARSWSRLPAFVNFWQEVPTFAEKSCKIDF